MKKLLLLTKTLLAVALLCVGQNAWAYDTPSGYKVGTVYVGHEVNNQVLAETFANYALNTEMTAISTNWSSNASGTTGFYWAKINNTVKTVAYPATNQAELFTCNQYTATHKTIKSYSATKISDSKAATLYSQDGENFYSDRACTASVTASDYTIDTGTATSIYETIYSTDGVTYYAGRDFQTVFNTTNYNVAADGTNHQIPSYVYGKCISVQHRNKSEFHLDYTMPTAVSSGKLVFGADFYRMQTVQKPLYIQFYDSSDKLVFQIYYQDGSGRQTMYYQVGAETAVGGAGYSDWRSFHGWGIKDMVFDLDAGTVSYTVDNVHWDSKNAENRRLVSQSAVSFGTGKNIAKVRFSLTGTASKTNYDFFVDNMYLYTLISETATTEDVTLVGSKDYEDGYLGSTSRDYVIQPNGNLHLEFKNYGSGAYNWSNWIAMFNNADKSSNLAYVRADAWELISSSNTGITTSSNYWDAFETDMYGSKVAMDITRTDGTVNMVATITTTASEEMSLTFNKAIGTATENIVFRLSEEAACLVIDNTKTSVSVTLGSNGYATFASPYPLDLTSATQTANGFTAYRASTVNSTTATFKDDVNQNVEANTGILLKGTANAVVSIPVVASGTALADNALKVNATGNIFAKESNTTYYGMNKNSDPLTFGTFDPSTVAIPANKAYLTITTLTSREISVVFGDITGVENVEAASEAKAKEGKFIENGKLVIVKNGQKFNAAGAKLY